MSNDFVGVCFGLLAIWTGFYLFALAVEHFGLLLTIGAIFVVLLVLSSLAARFTAPWT